MSPSSSPTAIWIVLLLFALLEVFVQNAVRLDYGPDEPDHLEYVHILAWHHRLPTPAETHLVQHPPVYYAVMGGAWRLAGVTQEPATLTPGPTALAHMTEQAVRGRRLLRFLNTLLACCTLFVLARILAAVGVSGAWQIVLMLFAAAIPMFQYVGAVVNNENLSILYSSVICLALVTRMRRGSCSLWQALGLGVLLGGCTLVKQTTLFALPLALWVVWSVGEGAERPKRFGLFAVGFALLGFWWPVHNHYASGQWFPSYTIPPDQAAQAAMMVQHRVLIGWVRAILKTSFLPDWSEQFLPHWLSTLAAAILIAGVLALFFTGLVARDETAGKRLRAVAVAGMSLLLLGIMQYCLFTDYRAIVGGRYLLNGLPWLVTLQGASLPLLGPKIRQSPSLIVILPLVLLGMFDAGWWISVQAYSSNPHFAQ